MKIKGDHGSPFFVHAMRSFGTVEVTGPYNETNLVMTGLPAVRKKRTNFRGRAMHAPSFQKSLCHVGATISRPFLTMTVK